MRVVFSFLANSWKESKQICFPKCWIIPFTDSRSANIPFIQVLKEYSADLTFHCYNIVRLTMDCLNKDQSWSSRTSYFILFHTFFPMMQLDLQQLSQRSLNIIYQILCSSLWSHERLHETFFTYAGTLPKTCKHTLSFIHFLSVCHYALILCWA